MSRNLSISDTGLRLIKAFEGYRPVDRELVTGARVVGYGHRVHDPMPRAMDRAEAEETLKLDLAAYEEMINAEVHAPLSQSQFDALCSLAFNIGPKAFRESDTVRALNNGRVLDAANGFDIWRKATINGQTYVVDALMRRRTAEKSLFLRTERSVPAGAPLEPEADAGVAALETDDGLPVFTEDMRNGVVAKAPYESVPNPMRRREDQPTGILTLSEVVEPGEAEMDVVDLVEADIIQPELEAEPEPEPGPAALDTGDDAPRSVIGEAADALSERLDALIDDGDADAADVEDWPQSLIRAARPEASNDTDDAPAPASNLVAFPAASARGPALTVTPDTVESQRLTAQDLRDTQPPALVIDDLAADDVMRDSRSPQGPVYAADDIAPDVEPVTGIWIPVVLGFALLGASGAALWLGARALLGEWGPLLALAGLITGALMVLYSLYLATAGREAR